MSWAVVGVVAGVVVAVSAAAGVSYQIYSSQNPPKTPQQATQALNKNQNQLAKLQAKLEEYKTKGKDTSKIEKAIADVQASISFLNQWIAQYGNMIAPTNADHNFANITNPIGNNTPTGTNSGAPQAATNKPWILIAGIVGAVLAVGFLVYILVTKKNK